MTAEETKLSKDDYMPASLRILNLDFDSSLEHVDYNIEKLSEMLTNDEREYSFDVLNHTVPIITNVCKLVEEPTSGHKDDTFCISTHLESCHQEEIENLKRKLESIRGNDIYQKLKEARNNAVAHTHTSYQGYGATQKALLEDATYLIEREDRLKNLVESIKSLIHDVEMSIRKKEGKPLNADTFTIRVVPPSSDLSTLNSKVC
ncbi:hypothetical protein C6499_05500 [Candidatus Poribacteria bacterium]|nr:MAG: hypothetical protein C6499_05500 [Candidatus Poribacteria bacterium]